MPNEFKFVKTSVTTTKGAAGLEKQLGMNWALLAKSSNKSFDIYSNFKQKILKPIIICNLKNK